MISVQTDYPVAVDSVDHLHPRGTKQDNTVKPEFVALMKPNGIKYMDLGCAGGGLVRGFLDSGGFAVGIDGSDYGRIHKFAEWANIPDNLFTADISKPFRVLEDGNPVLFDIITAWEVLEHIPEASVPQLLSNIRQHLTPGGSFLGSISRSTDTVDGIEYHCTVRQPDWWDARFAEAGLVPDEQLYNYVEPDWPRGTTGEASFPVAYSVPRWER